MNKKKLIIAGIILLVILILFGLQLLRNKPKQVQKADTSLYPYEQTGKGTGATTYPGSSPTPPRGTSAAEIKLKGSEIVERTRKFIEGLKIGAGQYTTTLICTRDKDKGSCQSTEIKSIIPGMLVLLYEELSAQTKIHQYQVQADTLMQEMLTNCQSDTDYCEWVFYPLFSRFKSTGDNQYLSAMKKVGEEVLLTTTPQEEAEEKLNVFANRINKLMMLYSATGETKYKEKADQRKTRVESVAAADSTNYQVYKEGNFVLRKNDCQMRWYVDYRYFQATGERKYLDELISFAQKANLGKNYLKIDNLATLTTCGETLLALYKETNEQTYLNTLHLLLQDGVKNYMDSDLKPKFNADNGFIIDKITLTDKNVANTKGLTENAWMTRLIIRAAMDKEFSL